MGAARATGRLQLCAGVYETARVVSREARFGRLCVDRTVRGYDFRTGDLAAADRRRRVAPHARRRPSPALRRTRARLGGHVTLIDRRPALCAHGRGRALHAARRAHGRADRRRRRPRRQRQRQGRGVLRGRVLRARPRRAHRASNRSARTQEKSRTGSVASGTAALGLNDPGRDESAATVSLGRARFGRRSAASELSRHARRRPCGEHSGVRS